MAKTQLTVSELRQLIKEEAIKLKKRLALENEKKALEQELKMLNESYKEEDNYQEELEEVFGIFKREMGDENSFRNDLKTKAISYAKLTGKKISQEEMDNLINQAKSDSWSGKLEVTKRGPEGQLVYVPGSQAVSRGASVTSISR